MRHEVIDLMRLRAWRWVPVALAPGRHGSLDALADSVQWLPLVTRNVLLSSIDEQSPAACATATSIPRDGGCIPEGEPWALASGPEQLLVAVATLAPQVFAIGAGLLAYANADEATAEAAVADLQRRAGGDWLLVRHPGLLRFEAAQAASNDVDRVEGRA